VNDIASKINIGADRSIAAIEKQILAKGNVFIDKRLDGRLKKEASHLGKEQLVLEAISRSITNSRSLGGAEKDRLMLMLIGLYRLNRQVHHSIQRELENDKELLKKRIRQRMESAKAHIDVHKKLLRIADRHFSAVKRHALAHKPGKQYSPEYMARMIYHENRARKIYKSLSHSNTPEIIHGLLVKKLDAVFTSVLGLTDDFSGNIMKCIELTKKNSIREIAKITEEMRNTLSKKSGILADFASKYTHKLVHSQQFLDRENNKIVLVTKFS